MARPRKSCFPSHEPARPARCRSSIGVPPRPGSGRLGSSHAAAGRGLPQRDAVSKRDRTAGCTTVRKALSLPVGFPWHRRHRLSPTLDTYTEGSGLICCVQAPDRAAVAATEANTLSGRYRQTPPKVTGRSRLCDQSRRSRGIRCRPAGVAAISRRRLWRLCRSEVGDQFLGRLGSADTVEFLESLAG
jgi:hypothetical protein